MSAALRATAVSTTIFRRGLRVGTDSSEIMRPLDIHEVSSMARYARRIDLISADG